MEWNKTDREALLQFKEVVDSDNIKVKGKIRDVLSGNKYIAHVLHNKELEENEAEPDDYFGVNIFDYYMISPVQSNVQNFVCYEVSYDELNRYNKCVKMLQIIFYVLCEQKNIRDEETGIPRHDLLAALIQDQFNYTNYFGTTIHMVSDVPSIVDAKYACRTLVFEQITDNNLVKTRSKQTQFANKGV